MSLPRKDVKAWFDPDYHSALRDICDADGCTLGEFVERVVVREIDRRLHEASQLQRAAERLGIHRNRQESAGTRRPTPEKQKR